MAVWWGPLWLVLVLLVPVLWDLLWSEQLSVWWYQELMVPVL